ncbi:MAG: tRNA (adenosine(37)-N6)-dimethylallyltransferase MiaA [Chitinophagaceae bacterium]|nr:tRNA (adenosine(37)-N6)-dimethylallyltransferase MiaA [Chitinophagaceae bacterium]
MHTKKTVYIIAGPTAVGKTAVSIALAQRLGTAIISADSRQCYKGMTKGTAKPDATELATVRHYFIDSHEVTQNLSAADYETLALGYIDQVLQQHDTAVVCGGTGLYIDALCHGLDEMPATDAEVVRTVEDAYAANGMEWLQKTVEEEDPTFYATGEIQNPARMIRALSFVRTTGTSITQYRTQSRKQRPFRIVKVALELPREILYNRINQRVDAMMEQGLESEVRALLPYRQLKNLQTVGYAELFEYFDGNCTLPEAIEKIKQHSRNYAKRQLTWFRKDPEMHWLRPDDAQVVEKIMAL